MSHFLFLTQKAREREERCIRRACCWIREGLLCTNGIPDHRGNGTWMYQHPQNTCRQNSFQKGGSLLSCHLSSANTSTFCSTKKCVDCNSGSKRGCCERKGYWESLFELNPINKMLWCITLIWNSIFFRFSLMDEMGNILLSLEVFAFDILCSWTWTI